MDPEEHVGDPDGPAWAARVLRAQRMPEDEIEALLEAADAEQIHRRLELHAERLQEELLEGLRTLSRLERLMTEQSRDPGGPDAAPILSPAGRR
jgi:hypothetical protein